MNTTHETTINFDNFDSTFMSNSNVSTRVLGIIYEIFDIQKYTCDISGTDVVLGFVVTPHNFEELCDSPPTIFGDIAASFNLKNVIVQGTNVPLCTISAFPAYLYARHNNIHNIQLIFGNIVFQDGEEESSQSENYIDLTKYIEEMRIAIKFLRSAGSSYIEGVDIEFMIKLLEDLGVFYRSIINQQHTLIMFSVLLYFLSCAVGTVL